MADVDRWSEEPELDLFSGLEPSLDTTFASSTRIDLDARSWVEHVPAWLEGSAQLFDELRASAQWEQRYRTILGSRRQEPRLTAEYDDVADAPHPRLREIVGALTEHYGVSYRRLWLNLYRHHRESTGWHADRIGRVQEVSTVPVLSLGATRRFLIRPAGGGPSIGLTVATGDLVVMRGRAQRDWHHCVPKQSTPAGPRISVNFAPAT